MHAKPAPILLAIVYGRLPTANPPYSFNPALNESGTWKGRTRISKMGDPLLRAKLYMLAVVAGQHNPVSHLILIFCLHKKRRDGIYRACVMQKICS